MPFVASFPRPLATLPRANDTVRLFTPNWFAASMGTGVVALVLGHFSDIPALHGAGFILWLANVGLFAVFAILYAARWIFYFDGARRVLDHPTMSMSLGCIPMAIATIANGCLVFGIDLFGPAAVTFAQGLWWLESALAIACGLGVPVLMITRQSHSHADMTGMWFLPIVAAEVSAATGALLIPHLPLVDQSSALLFTLLLWSFSVPLAVGITIVLLVRMVLHKLPHASMAASCWLALGPLATGALGLMLVAQAMPTALGSTALAPLATAMAGASMLLATMLWAYGLWWIGLATLITLRYFREPVPFNLGWWAYVFPIGVFTLATFTLGAIWNNPMLALFGIILSASTFAVWCVVAARTIAGAWSGALFSAPCLADS